MAESETEVDSLDEASARAELKRLQNELGITFVHVTHSQDEALALSDLVVLMKDGHIEQSGTPREVFDTPKTAFVARFIGAHNVLTDAGREVSLRADKLVLTDVADGRRTATVTSVEYQGHYVLVRLSANGEELSAMVARGELQARFIKVESEHSALACCIAASTMGARAFTATSSHGLLLSNLSPQLWV